jgi:hypothetical protein
MRKKPTKLEDELNIGLDATEKILEEEIKTEGIEKDYKNDYEFLRETLITITKQGKRLLELALIRAEEDASARTVESASAAVRSIGDASEKLMRLHKEILELKIKLKDKDDAEGDGKKDNKVSGNLSGILHELEVIEGGKSTKKKAGN